MGGGSCCARMNIVNMAWRVRGYRDRNLGMVNRRRMDRDSVGTVAMVAVRCVAYDVRSMDKTGLVVHVGRLMSDLVHNACVMSRVHEASVIPADMMSGRHVCDMSVSLRMTVVIDVMSCVRVRICFTWGHIVNFGFLLNDL